MNILMLAGWYYPDSMGGTEKYVHDLGTDLQESGLEITVATPASDEAEKSYVHDGLQVYRYPVSLNSSGLTKDQNSEIQNFKIFQNWIKNKKPDVAHIHSFTRGCGLPHAQYLKSLSIPIVITVHVPGVNCARGTMMRWGRTPCDGEMREYRCTACCLQQRGLPLAMAWTVAATPRLISAGMNTIQSPISTAMRMRQLIITRSKGVRLFLDLADRVVVVSEWLYDTLKLNGVSPSKLLVCKHGLKKNKNEVRQKLPTLPDFKGVRVGYVGRFNPVKGVDILVEVIKGLSPDIPIQLHMYGVANDEEEKAYLARLKGKIGNDNRFVFGGELTNENRQTVLSNLDIIAVPSVWFETGPFVILEAFDAGLPIIGSNLGAIPELVQHQVNGILIKAGDKNAWAQALRQICLNPLEIKRLASKIPPVKSSEEVSREMLELYKEILNY